MPTSAHSRLYTSPIRTWIFGGLSTEPSSLSRRTISPGNHVGSLLTRSTACWYRKISPVVVSHCAASAISMYFVPGGYVPGHGCVAQHVQFHPGLVDAHGSAFFPGQTNLPSVDPASATTTTRSAVPDISA
ncbi:hypothetical protein PBRA_006283 [Plasmodiophora brassicae]|uniref:Uncharacterized protein n=1 Tax=Plasmodiophora brassicae TaxID=37360 RepID=A0A0G4ISQ8_PLABS|nr:hypothetical protein PBRA_006283 [Plasmodiophora brassicae]